jgi:TRAP-type mannitol/chloroaromatic compound transport system permease small subunit
MLFSPDVKSALAALRKVGKLPSGVRHEEDMLNAALGLSTLIDRVTAFIGKSVSWLVLAAVVVSAVNAIIRKTFDTSSNAWLEAQWYLFGAVFMLAAAWVLQINAHVRIDALSSHFSQRTRNWIDLFGHIFFLMPLCLLMIWLTIPYFWESYIGNEISTNAGGLVVWPTKLFILIGFVLLTFQAISEVIKRIAVINGMITDPHTGGAHG